MTIRQYQILCNTIYQKTISLGGNPSTSHGLRFSTPITVKSRVKKFGEKTGCSMSAGSFNWVNVIDGINNPFNPTVRFHNMGPGQLAAFTYGHPSFDLTSQKFDPTQFKALCEAVKTADGFAE